MLLEPCDDRSLGLVDGLAVEKVAVHVRTVAGVGGLLDVGTAGDDLADRQVEGAGEGVVPLVMTGAGEDRSGSVGGQHIVGDPHRYPAAVDGVDGVGAGERAGLGRIDGLAGPIALGHSADVCEVDIDCGPLRCGGDPRHQRMLGCEHGVGTAEQGVWPCGEHREARVAIGDGECDLGAVRAADPLSLHGLDAFRPVDELQIVDQAVRVRGDLQHPLLHGALLDRISGLHVHAVLDFLVGEHGAQGRAPVHGNLRLVGEATAVELEEDPLGPAIVGLIAGGELTAPVVRQAELGQLLLEGRDVPLGDLSWVLAFLDCLALRGETEAVPAHDAQHIEAHHASCPGDDIGGDVALGMPDVKPRAARVGEHVEHVVLGARPVRGRRERILLLPGLPPLGFDG